MRKPTPVLLITLLIGAAVAAPANAADYQPDAQLELVPSGDFTGALIYSSDGTGQKVTVRLRPGEAQNANLWIVNNGTLTDSMWVSGCSSAGRFRVTYRTWDFYSDITYLVTNGLFQSIDLPGGSAVWINAKIKAKARAQRGDRLRCPMSLTSSNSSIVDKLILKVLVRS